MSFVDPDLNAGRAATPLRGKVLYVEDDETNVLVVRALCERHPGIQMLHAASGRDGIGMVRS